MRKDSCNSDSTLYDNLTQIYDFYQPEDEILKELMDAEESKELPSIPTGLDGNITFSVLINDLLSQQAPLTCIPEEISDVVEGEFKITWEHQPSVLFKDSKCKSLEPLKRWVVVDGDVVKICVSFRNRKVEIELDLDNISELEKVSRNKFMFKVKGIFGKLHNPQTLVLFECASAVVAEKVFDALQASLPNVQDPFQRRFSLEQSSPSQKFQNFMAQVKRSISFRRPSLA